jgi:hypothetical protein
LYAFWTAKGARLLAYREIITDRCRIRLIKNPYGFDPLTV